MPEHATGLLLDHPVTQAAYADPRNWPMTLLMEGVPFRVPPPEYTCPGVRPTALDQDGIGACVAFSGVNIKDTQEKLDHGAWLYDTPTAFLAYNRLKRGWGEWPGDGIDSEGSYPQAFWEMARKVGVEDRNGRAWKISAWYTHDLADDDDLAFLQQVLLTFGPVSFGTVWPTNWFADPSAAEDYRMPTPAGGYGGHAYSCIGWKTIAGVVWLTFVNTWGPWGSPQGIFRAKASWFYVQPLGPQIVHKIVDFDDVPDPPAPVQEDTVRAYDALPRTFNCATGTQFYKQDGVTPLVALSSGGVGLYSPCRWSVDKYNVRISTGGIAQLAVVKAADVSNVRPYGPDCTIPVAAERKRWTDWLLLSPK